MTDEAPQTEKQPFVLSLVGFVGCLVGSAAALFAGLENASEGDLFYLVAFPSSAFLAFTAYRFGKDCFRRR